MIGATLEELSQRHGATLSTDRYRPDLYFTSYTFAADSYEVEATLCDGQCAHLMVAYPEEPAGMVVEHALTQFSGLADWIELPTTDPQFPEYFPLFSPNRNRFFRTADSRAFAMVQTRVGLGALVLWFCRWDYPSVLRAYRKGLKPSH